MAQWYTNSFIGAPHRGQDCPLSLRVLRPSDIYAPLALGLYEPRMPPTEVTRYAKVGCCPNMERESAYLLCNAKAGGGPTGWETENRHSLHLKTAMAGRKPTALSVPSRAIGSPHLSQVRCSGQLVSVAGIGGHIELTATHIQS
jgi:hypothetical protein